MAYTPYGLTYGLAQIGSQAMPQYYAAQSRALKSETDQMEAQALQQQIQQRDMTMDRYRKEAEAKDRNAELERHLEGARLGLIRRDFNMASQYLGVPIEEDENGDYLITDTNSGKKFKTSRGEMHSALAGKEELAQWARGLQTQEGQYERQVRAAVDRAKAAEEKYNRDLAKKEIDLKNRLLLREFEQGGRAKMLLARANVDERKLTTQMRNYLELSKHFKEQGDPDFDERALQMAFPGYNKPQADAVKLLLSIAGEKMGTYDINGAREAIEKAFSEYKPPLPPRPKTKPTDGPLVAKIGGKTVKLTPK